MSAAVRTRRRLRVERRPHVRGLVWFRVGGALLGLAAALVALPLYASGSSGELYSALWRGTFGSALGWSDVLMSAAPLILTGLACSLPYRIGLWNVGADGQMYVGAWVASAIAFSVPGLSAVALIPAMLVGAVIGGMAWILLPALARALLGVNEIVTTLMLNFVALYWLTYWASGPWAEKSSVGGVQSRLLPGQAELANISIGPVSVHWGFLLAVAVALIVALVLRVTRFGFELPILGASERAGAYAGIATRRRMIQVFLLGGAMAGLAGVVEMMGTVHQYSSAVSDNTGYSGIVVAIVAAGSALGVLAIAILFAAISVGGVVLSTNDVASGVGTGLFGAILLFAAIGDSLARFRVSIAARPRETAAPPVSTPIGAPPA
jgi:simple sugar transport system permease protein